MSLLNLPFLKCLHPRKVRNPYTGEIITVSCGKCEACQMNKSSRYAFQCKLESYASVCSVFVTLTFDNNNIPYVRLVDSGSLGCDIVSSSGEILDKVFSDDFGLAGKDMFLKKVSILDGRIPVLSKSALQLFIKRFRITYERKGFNTKIRYFACGEYGPKTYRPHYHIIFFFNDRAQAACADEVVRACWTLGRVDVQATKGTASNYVAGYVNSTGFIPRFFKTCSLRPFCTHSQWLGLPFLKNERKNIYEKTPAEFIHRSMFLDGKYKQFDVWRSCSAFFFPRCKKFASLPACRRSYSYRLWSKARIYYPSAACQGASKVAQEIAIDIFLYGDRPRCNFDASHCEFLRYFSDNDEFPESCTSPEDEDFLKFVNRVYSELLLSKHFLTYVCDTQSVYEINRKLRLIDEFWSYVDLMHLSDQLSAEQLYFESDICQDEDLYLFYDNTPATAGDIVNSRIYGRWQSQIYSLYNDRIKHKKLNDANKIFLEQR